MEFRTFFYLLGLSYYIFARLQTHLPLKQKSTFCVTPGHYAPDPAKNIRNLNVLALAPGKTTMCKQILAMDEFIEISHQSFNHAVNLTL